MFLFLIILFFILTQVAIYLLYKISPLRDKLNLKKSLYISGSLFLFFTLAIFSLKAFSTIWYFEYVYVFISLLFSFVFYLVVFSPLSLLAYLFLKKQKKSLTITFYSLISVAFLFSLLGFYQLNSTDKITYLHIPTENPNLQNKKYAFLADPQFSIATQGGFAKRITKILENIHPEKIFIAGDMFNGEDLNWQPILEEMKSWSKVAPVYAVTGNHGYYGDYNNFIKLMVAADFKIISNEIIHIDGVSIFGSNFAFNQIEKENLKKLIRENLSQEKVDVAFMHEPPNDMLSEIIENSPTFVFSGHTHNGQFWPLNYLVRIKYGKFIYGKNIIKNTIFYTTSGFGISLIPNRLFNTPEIVVVNFTK